MLKTIAYVLNGVIKVDCLAVKNISYALEVILYCTLQETDGLIYSPLASLKLTISLLLCILLSPYIILTNSC